ncbi:MAG: hypothetical protein KF820_04190 [Candidatus Paracaedibacteraceae bacterium]|nr:hypothetical protein [Candidatus Paracaedibacteraceae bacterium]
MVYFLTIIVTLLQLIVTIQAMDIDEHEAFILPIDVNQEVFSYLSPLDLRALKLTGNQQVLRQLYVFTKAEVERSLYQKGTSPELYKERQNLCDTLPFAFDDYQSRYNLITHFDQIAEITQGAVVDSHSCRFGKFSSVLQVSVLDFMVSLHNEAAIKLKFLGLIRGDYGYEKNHPQAHAFLYEHVLRGSPVASDMLHNGLLNGSYFFRANPQKAQQLLNDKVSEGQVWALERQYNRVKKGWRICDPENPELAHEFLLYHVDSLNIWAVQTFLDLMSDYQHKDTPEFINRTKQLIAQLQEHGYPWLKRAKLKALAKGYYPGERAKDYLMDGVKRGERWAVQSYIEGLKYGSYGINVSKEELRQLIDQGCQELDPLALYEKYDIHHSVYRGFVWDADPKCGSNIRQTAIRLGESWAIKEEIISQGNQSYRGEPVNLKLLEQVFDLHAVPMA